MNTIKFIQKKNISKCVTIFTDGSAKNNGKKTATGGIGVFFGDNDSRNVGMETKLALKSLLPDYSFKKWKVTNNISELTAVLKALKIVKNELKHNYNVIIKSDSQYVINCLTKWYPNWVKNKFINSAGKPVANKEIIQEILNTYIIPYKKQIHFFHVSAHTTEPSKTNIMYTNWHGNNEADKLSNQF